MAATIDKKEILRDKRAQGIAAMGLVTRHADRFQVQTPSLRGRRTAYEVWRDDANRVRCSCLEYEEHAAENPAFRCEHILAVKHSLVAKNSEAVMKQGAASHQTSQPITGATNDVTLTTKDESASEKPAGVQPHARFEREQTQAETQSEMTTTAHIEAVESSTAAPVVRSLAQHTQTKEQEMNHHTSTPVLIDTDNDFNDESPAHEAHTAQVVPLAFTNVLRTLRQPVDAKLVKTREGWTDRNGNTHLVEYIEWHTVADTLDRVSPAWSHSVRDIKQIGDMVAVTVAITIDGVTREGVGTGSADNETGIKKAEHDALKRAAIKFGLARDLYQRESEVIERNGSTPEANGEFPRDPLAKSMSDLVTPKQLGMIRALAREAGMDADDECQSVMRCRTEELSKRAASSFIDHLKNANAAVADAGMRRAS